MSTYLERKTPLISKQAQTSALGEKWAVTRCRDTSSTTDRVRFMGDDPLLSAEPARSCGMACGERKRPCCEGGSIPA